MIQSMTGFAEKKYNSKTFSVKVTIKSLNHRFFDWSLRGGQIGELESRLRSICQQQIHRGRIDVHLDMNFSDPSRWQLQINEDLLAEILTSLESIAAQTKKNVTFAVENIFNIPHIAELKRKDFTPEEMAFIEDSFTKTLQELIRIRAREGRLLKRDIRGHIAVVKQALLRIERLGKKQPALIREKLKERLQELGNHALLSEEKLIEETAFMAQRYDLAEEIERMKSHLDHFQELLVSKEREPVGKKLDFIAQELFREANTINSKAQDINIIKESVKAKGELESIRQQVQNLE